jgi:hypothetical protein
VSQQRLAFLVAATGVGLAVVSGASSASAATAQHSASAKSTAHSSTSVSTASLKRVSFPCKSPKKQLFTVSWSKKTHIPGINRTYRFYFNNHCDQTRIMSINMVSGSKKAPPYLMAIHAHIKGDKTLYAGNVWHLNSVTAY